MTDMRRRRLPPNRRRAYWFQIERRGDFVPSSKATARGSLSWKVIVSASWAKPYTGLACGPGFFIGLAQNAPDASSLIAARWSYVRQLFWRKLARLVITTLAASPATAVHLLPMN